MNVPHSGEQVLARIGFAERWLHRAKQQCAQGNLARGALTLVLADAEMHHAMEVAGMPRRVRRYRRIDARTVAAVTLATGAAALAAVLVLPWSAPADSPTSQPAPLVVRLATPGELLLAGPAIQPAAPMAATGRWHGSPAPLSVAATVTRMSPPADVPGASHPTGGPDVSPESIRMLPVESGTTSGVTARVTTTPLLSMSEVVDLVLAAERALRSEPIILSSP